MTFRYDALGRRIERAGPAASVFVFDRKDVLETLSASGSPTMRFTQGLGIDERLSQRSIPSGETTFSQTDALGSVSVVTNASGQITQVYRYDSFGNISPAVSSEVPAYTGREWDPISRLFYFRERYYDSDIGRFISEDPIGFTGGANFYAYVRGNPVRWTDPFGLRSRVCCKQIPLPLGAGFRHCYVESDEGSGRTSYGLLGGWFSGEEFATGKIYLNNGFDRGGECGEWNEADCIVDQCVRIMVSAYANPSEYRILRGPNSNTFAGTIARACGLTKPNVSPVSTPGWGDKPAPQKRGKPSTPPENLSP